MNYKKLTDIIGILMSETLEKIKKKKWVIKCIVAFLLFWYIFESIDNSSLFLIVNNADLYLLSLAFLLAFIAQIPVSNVKWLIILKAYDASVGFQRLCRIYLVAMYFSIFLPGSYGGDFLRAFQVSKYTKGKTEGFMSVILDRLSGLIGLFIILLFALIFVDQTIISYSLRMCSIAAIVTGLIIMIILLSGWGERLSSLFSFAGEGFNSKIKEVYVTIHRLKDVKTVVLVVLLSILFQFMVVLVNYIVAISLNINVPFGYLMLVIPLISLFSMIPLTPSGIGVRDISYIGFFSLLGIDREPALLLGVIQFLMVVTMSLYGGLIYLRQE